MAGMAFPQIDGRDELTGVAVSVASDVVDRPTVIEITDNTAGLR